MNDAERLRHDPAMRWIVGGKAAHGRAASPSQMGRFETQWLAAAKNLSALADLSGKWIDRVHARRPPRGIVLDMDSSVSPTHGEQENSVWNGHYDCTCYHPLFVFNQFGDLERCSLRPGNVHSADGWDGVLKPVVARYQGKRLAHLFPGRRGLRQCRRSTSSSKPSGSNMRSAYRPTKFCKRGSAILLTRPVGRPPNEVRRFHANFTYQAGSWTKPRRVIAKVEWHPGELYPRVGFIVTNMSRPAERVVAFYNKRGTCEQWIKEGKGAIKWTRLSCRTFAANAVRLQLHALAYNLGNFLRTLATPEPIKDWSLTSLKDKLIKIGAKVVSHGRYVAFQMAEVAIPRQMFAGHLATDRGTAAAATTSASVRRSMVMHSAATDRRSASKCQGKWPDQALNASWTAWSIGSWQDLQFCACPQSRKSLTFTSVRDSSGESRLKAPRMSFSHSSQRSLRNCSRE